MTLTHDIARCPGAKTEDGSIEGHCTYCRCRDAHGATREIRPALRTIPSGARVCKNRIPLQREV